MSANDLSRLPDDDLMVLIANGVIEQPGDELYLRHGEALFGFVARQCKGDTRRAAYYMEQTWIKLLTRCGDYTAHADFRAFLFETAGEIIAAGEGATNNRALKDASATFPVDETLATRIHELTLQVQAAQAPRRRALMQELAQGKRTRVALGSKVSGRTWFWLRTHRKIKEVEKARAAKRPWWQRFVGRDVTVAIAAFLTAALGTQWFFARQAKETPVQVAVPRSETSSAAETLRSERPTPPERSAEATQTQRDPATPARRETAASPARPTPSSSPSAAQSLPAKTAQEGSPSADPANAATTETTTASAPSSTQSSSDPEVPPGTDTLLEEDPSRVLRALPLPRGKFKVIAHIAQPERPAAQTWLAHLQSSLPSDAPLDVVATDQLAPHLVRIEIAPMP